MKEIWRQLRKSPLVEIKCFITHERPRNCSLVGDSVGPCRLAGWPCEGNGCPGAGVGRRQPLLFELACDLSSWPPGVYSIGPSCMSGVGLGEGSRSSVCTFRWPVIMVDVDLLHRDKVRITRHSKHSRKGVSAGITLAQPNTWSWIYLMNLYVSCDGY